MTSIHVVFVRYTGNISPAAIQPPSRITPRTVLTTRFKFVRLMNPKQTASGMNSMEAVATEPLAGILTIFPVASSTADPANVPATISANAATTSTSTSQANMVKHIFVFRPMFSSMTSPRDCPLWRTDANNAEKSCTAPKNIPPMRIHNSTGTQPKTAAWIGPLIGPAPAIDEK